MSKEVTEWKSSLYLYKPNYRIIPEKSWWWVERDDFMVAFGPVPGFTEMTRYHFRRWLPPGQGNILILQRTQASFTAAPLHP